MDITVGSSQEWPIAWFRRSQASLNKDDLGNWSQGRWFGKIAATQRDVQCIHGMLKVCADIGSLVGSEDIRIPGYHWSNK